MTRKKFLEFIKLNIEHGIDDEFYFKMVMVGQALSFGYTDIIEEIEEMIGY